MFTIILTSLQCHLDKDNGLEIVPQLQNNLFTMAVNQLLTKGEYKTVSLIGKIAKLDPHYALLNFFSDCVTCL